MPRNKKAKTIDRWVKRNQSKHPCHCGCGLFIEVKREHYKPSSGGIPKFIKGHNLQPVSDEPVVIPSSNLWDRLSDEEKERRISMLKSFERGEKNPAWKGGRHLNDHGYIQVLCPDHPYANKDGYVVEHRLVVEERTRDEDPDNPLLIEIDGKKYLKQVAVVHHIDENKTNNSSENLMLLPHAAAHAFIHNSPLPMEERLRRISLGIFHSRPLNEEADDDKK